MSFRKKPSPKIILITGGDRNNIDKGIVPASIGVLLKANGYNITVIKMDPCFNRNSINLDPTKYGEKYCLADGEIVSVNFGYYERILDQIFTKFNYITRGKIDDFVNEQNELKNVGDKIRAVNVVAATVNWIKGVCLRPIDGKNILPDICIIELGAEMDEEISDKRFLAALSEFKQKNNFMHIHISKLIGGKFGFLEKSVQNFRNRNWRSDLIICRSKNPFSDVYKKHIAQFAELDADMVINLPEVSDVKYIPIKLKEQNIYNLISNHLQLKNGPNFETKMNELKAEIKVAESYKTVVKIALVGKYLINPLQGNEIFQESYESMVQQLNIAAEQGCHCKVEICFIRAQDLEDDATEEKRNAAWEILKEVHGILIPGGTGSEGIKGLIRTCKFARKNKKPFLSICYGFQCAVAEFAQNVVGIYAGESCKKVLEKVNVVTLENGRPRMGTKTVTFLTKNSKLFELYGKKNFIQERNWNRYEIDPKFISSLISRGLRFVGIGFDENENGEISENLQNLMSYAKIHDANDEKGYIKTMEKLCHYSRKTHTALRMQSFELTDHPYYVGVQYHAKFGLRPSSPSPPFVGLIKAALCEMDLKEAKNEMPSLIDDQEIDDDEKQNALIQRKKSSDEKHVEIGHKKDKRFFIFFIKCKKLVKDGLLRIKEFKDYLKTKLCDFASIKIDADEYRIIVTSDGKFSKSYLQVLTKKYLEKKGLRKYVDFVSVEKYELYDRKKMAR